MVAVQNSEIRKAADTLYELSVDKKVRAEYEMREKAWRDRMWQIGSGIEKGRAEGRAEGRKEGMQKALELIKSGKTPEEATKILGMESGE